MALRDATLGTVVATEVVKAVLRIGTPLGGTPAEFGTLLSTAIEKWGKVIKFAGIKAD